MSGPAIELEGITKRYPGVIANDHVDLAARVGEIHALVGENGAGKTTLMRVLGGLTPPDEGTIRVRGREVSFASAADAAAAGIGMVHQHFTLVPVFTVLENVVLGDEPGFIGGLDGVRDRVVELAGTLGFSIDPDRIVETLTVGERQKVEILRTLLRGARILVLDEPTAVLTPQESRDLFKLLRRLVKEGRTVLFISHRLAEVLAASDRITVMRGGRSVTTIAAAGATEGDLARLMVGREVLLPSAVRGGSEPGEPVLDVSGARALSDRGVPALSGVDLTVRAGEVLGIGGVMGNGQTELMESIAGLRPLTAGAIVLEGADLLGWDAAARIRAGISFVPEDRLDRGLVATMSVEENLALGLMDDERLFRGPFMRMCALRQRADATLKRMDTRPSDPGLLVSTFSGGNQQKVLLGRAFDSGARLILLMEPSRGLDVGAMEIVFEQVRSATARGVGVLLVSSDLTELMSLSDRILVIRRGRIAGEVHPGETTEEELGLMMAGGGA